MRVLPLRCVMIQLADEHDERAELVEARQADPRTFDDPDEEAKHLRERAQACRAVARCIRF